MIENRSEQVEALEVMKEYNLKLVKALKEMADELKGARKEDTDDYLDHIFKGVNWELQVINGTLELLNEKKSQISKDTLNKMVEEINDAYTNKDDEKIVSILGDATIPFFEELDGYIDVALA
jgi:uncharacterized protein YicC (UPF0701 family)